VSFLNVGVVLGLDGDELRHDGPQMGVTNIVRTD